MKRALVRGGLIICSIVALGAAALLVDAWRALGQGADGPRLERMRRSPQWTGSSFGNPQPMWTDAWGSVFGFMQMSPVASPRGPLTAVTHGPESFAAPPKSGLRVTWLGHSSVLVELDGSRVLLDPVWGDRPFPFTWTGPMRWYPPPVALDDLPNIDAVLISHDHYDHLDLPTIEQIKHWPTTFIVPLGVGAHLEYWGVPAARIVEVDWWDEIAVNNLRIVATPSRHASGRTGIDYQRTLWSGFAVIGPEHRIYYSGDTGMFPGITDIGRRLGPFDLTMVEVGAYDQAWPDWHMGPEQAVAAHHLVRGEVFLPVHWGLWNLANHGWTEPAERVLTAAQARGTILAMPRPGESIEPAKLGPVVRWWPKEPWRTHDEYPLVSGGLGDM